MKMSASEAVRKAHAAYLAHERRVDVQQALFSPVNEENLTDEIIPAMIESVRGQGVCGAPDPSQLNSGIEGRK